VFSAFSQFRPEYRPLVVAERIEPIKADSGLVVLPNQTFEDVPHPEILVVPGGGQPTLRALSHLPLRHYVRQAAETAEYVGSVCTGALILGAVGLLEGRPATTHWSFPRLLEQFGARYQRQRWVHDGKYIMSAGVAAGIDAALYMVAQLSDEATARKVQLALQYDPHPPFGQIDWDNLGLMFRLTRGYVNLQARSIAAKPRQLTAQGL
jgi:transcriptional regulator GlxA family with amidase domain